MSDTKIKNLFSKLASRLDSLNVDNWDIYCVTEKSRQISARNKTIEDFLENFENGYSIRILKDQKLSMAYSNRFDDISISKTIDKAEALLKYITPDEDFQINDQIDANLDILGAPDIDFSIDTVALSKKNESLYYIEEEAFKHHSSLSKLEYLSYSESWSQIFYRTKNSSLLTQEQAYYGYSGDIIAEDGDDMEAGSAFCYKKQYSELDLDKLAEKLAYNAYSMLHAKPIKSGVYPVILENEAMASFVASFFQLFSADAVQNNKSVLSDRLYEKIAISDFSIVDDATDQDGLGFLLFDGEGSAGQKTEVITDGVLKSFLFDLKTAKKGKVSSTGNAIRSSYQGLPLIKPTNLIIKPGLSSYKELTMVHSEVLVVANVVGMHTVNKVNGDFSVGASGYLVRNGEIAHPVKQITIAGNFIDILNRIESIGEDSDHFPYNGNIVTPSVLFSEMMISGAGG